MQIYGHRKIHRDILDSEQEKCCSETVRRIMKELGIHSIRVWKRKVITTDSNHTLPIAENLLQRDFTATALNSKWLADITISGFVNGFILL